MTEIYDYSSGQCSLCEDDIGSNADFVQMKFPNNNGDEIKKANLCSKCWGNFSFKKMERKTSKTNIFPVELPTKKLKKSEPEERAK